MPKPKTQLQFQIKAKSDDTVDVYIYDDIGESWWGGGLTAKNFINELKKHKSAKNITVHLNSPGGDVNEGVAIYNALKEHGAEIEMRIEGLAASIASIIAMAGDKIVIHDNAFVMIHDPWTLAMGASDDLRKTAELLDKVKGTLVTTYAQRTGQDEDTISQKMADETWFTGEEAVEFGLADEVVAGKRLSNRFDLKVFKNIPADLLNSICNCKTHNETEPKPNADPDPASNTEEKPEVGTPGVENHWRLETAKRVTDSIRLN